VESVERGAVGVKGNIKLEECPIIIGKMYL